MAEIHSKPPLVAMVLRQINTQRAYRIVVVGDETAMGRAFEILGSVDCLIRVHHMESSHLLGSGPYLLSVSSLLESEIRFARPSADAAAAGDDMVKLPLRAVGVIGIRGFPRWHPKNLHVKRMPFQQVG